MARTTRRGLMIAKPKGGLSTHPLSAPNGDDAHLVVFCNQFMILQAELDAQAQRDHVPDGELNAVVDAQNAIVDKMDALTATTLAAHRARAMVFDKWFNHDEEGNFDLELSWLAIGPLIRDLIGGPV